MKIITVAVLLFVCACGPTLVQQANATPQTNGLPTEITVAGETYEDVRWGSVTPLAVTVFHRNGVATFPLESLSPELQKRLGYSPSKAAASRAAEALHRKAQAERVARDAADQTLQARSKNEEAEQASKLLVLDFIRGTLNGHKLSSLTADTVTDMLGRPDKTANEYINGAHFSYLYYFTKGVRVCYMQEKGKTSQTIHVTVYLSEQPADDPSTLEPGSIGFYSAYTGKLTKDVDGNWKLQKFLEKFRSDGVVEREEPSASVVASGKEFDKKNGWRDMTGDYYWAAIERGSLHGLVNYDPASKFLTRLEVYTELTER